jgi:RNA polymerase sigma-70 factor, ECF subfamily
MPFWGVCQGKHIGLHFHRTFPRDPVYSIVEHGDKAALMISSADPQVSQLVRAAQTGDQEAFAALYQRYGALVYRTAYLLLGDAGHAEELMQDVFVRLHSSLARYQPERGAFSTWLHSITVHACLNARRRRLWGWLSLDRARSEGVELPASELPPLDLALRGEEQRRIWRAVQRLPIKLRAAVVLRYYHDLSYEELSQALACPVGTVRSRLHAAHAKLRADLDDHK